MPELDLVSKWFRGTHNINFQIQKDEGHIYLGIVKKEETQMKTERTHFTFESAQIECTKIAINFLDKLWKEN